MQIGIVGLGRMGGNMATRLLRDQHQVFGFDPDAAVLAELEAEGGSGKTSLADLVNALDTPRTVWVMVPAGDITQSTVDELSEHMSPGDTLIDGGNSNYKESIQRANELAEKGIDMLDSGTSGGIWGLENGYCLTIGGNREAYERNLPIFKTLAPPRIRRQPLRSAPSGSGHYVKMIHNGIEYGMMQAFAEGLELLEAKSDFNLDLAAICENWRYGSVIRSWLLDLTADELSNDPGLDELSSYVEDSGEGRWTVDASVELAVPAPVITAALQMRFRSRQEKPNRRTRTSRNAQRLRRPQRQTHQWRITTPSFQKRLAPFVGRKGREPKKIDNKSGVCSGDEERCPLITQCLTTNQHNSPSSSSAHPATSRNASSPPRFSTSTPSAHSPNVADSSHSHARNSTDESYRRLLFEVSSDDFSSDLQSWLDFANEVRYFQGSSNDIASPETPRRFHPLYRQRRGERRPPLLLSALPHSLRKHSTTPSAMPECWTKRTASGVWSSKNPLAPT